jgi:hypothetical protein
MFFDSDRTERFLAIYEEWDAANVASHPDYNLRGFVGNPEDCFIFHRVNNIEDMEGEEDELYAFITPDQSIYETFNRFQTRKILKRLGPQFTEDKIDFIISYIWNYRTLVINKKTAEFDPYSGFEPSPFKATMGNQGTFHRKTVYV